MLTRILTWMVVLGSTSLVAGEADPEGGATKIDRLPEGKPCLLICGVDARRRRPLDQRSQGPRIGLAAWADGHILWSKDRVVGGPPYHAARIDPEEIRQLLHGLEKEKAFGDEALRRARFGPDAAHVVILVQDGKRSLRMSSWHENVKRRPELVATAKGMEPLRGRSHEEVLREQPEEYGRFLAIWDIVRARAEKWVSGGGWPYEGAVPVLGTSDLEERRDPSSKEEAPGREAAPPAQAGSPQPRSSALGSGPSAG